MNSRISASAAASLILVVALPGIAQDTAPLSQLARVAWGHHFYSEWIPDKSSRIDYVVCNQTAATSDFFWPYAAFGVGSATGLPANHCVQKSDYLTRIVDGGESFLNAAATAEIIKETAEVPTVIWCEFGLGDRCDQSLVGGIISWTSTLRAFAQGADNPATPPILSGRAQLEGGRYEIDIRRDDQGRLLIVAVSPSSEGLQLETPGVESVSGVLGELRPLPESGLYQGLSPVMSAVLVPAAADPEVGTRIIFSNQTPTPVSLAIIALADDVPTLRIDTVPLLAPLQ